MEARNAGRKIEQCERTMNAAVECSERKRGYYTPLSFSLPREGEVVLDIGSGEGIDCLLTCVEVGRKGRVIGVDTAPEMIHRAKINARNAGLRNVEFRLVRTGRLPLPDSHVDMVISNCAINLSWDKKKVFAEAFRCLKPGGRLMVSDLLVKDRPSRPLGNSILTRILVRAGTMGRDDYIHAIKAALFQQVKVVDETAFEIDDNPGACTVIKGGLSEDEAREITRMLMNIKVSAVKPKL